MGRAFNNTGRLTRYRLLVTALALLAGVQAYTLTRGTAGPSAGNSYVSLESGRLLDDTLMSQGEKITLAQIGAGSCRYVVVYAKTCGASVAAARQWARAAENDGPLLPDGWTSIWVEVGPSDSTATEGLSNLPVVRAWAQRAGQLESSYSITAYPVHIILNRSGRVVEASIGAALPSLKHLTADCREIHESPNMAHL